MGTSISHLREEGVLPAVGDGGTLPLSAAIAVKEAVLPFGRFHGVDTVLGPEMKSTGEVMGIDALFGTAYAKSQMAAYSGGLPTKGHAFVSVANRDKRSMIFPVKRLHDLGSKSLPPPERRRCSGATVCQQPSSASISSRQVTDRAPDTIARILDGSIDLIVNTPYGVGARLDGYEIRSAAVQRGVPCITTVQGLAAAVQGIEALIRGEIDVKSLQEHAADLHKAREAELMAPLQVRGEVLSHPSKRRLPAADDGRAGNRGTGQARAIRGAGSGRRPVVDVAATSILGVPHRRPWRVRRHC